MSGVRTAVMTALQVVSEPRQEKETTDAGRWGTVYKTADLYLQKCQGNKVKEWRRIRPKLKESKRMCLFLMAQMVKCRRLGFDPRVRRMTWRKEWLSTPVFLPERSHGQRSLAGYSPRGHKDSDTTEWLRLYLLLLLKGMWQLDTICDSELDLFS